MKCPEKLELQQKCTAAWDAYAAEAERQGLLVNPNGGISLPSASELIARARKYSGTFSKAYAAAIRLRGEHLAASRNLSRHLTGHRC